MKKLFILLALALVGLKATAYELTAPVAIKVMNDVNVRFIFSCKNYVEGETEKVTAWIDAEKTMIEKQMIFSPKNGNDTVMFTGLIPGHLYYFTLGKGHTFLASKRTIGVSTLLVGFRGEIIQQNLRTSLFINSSTAPDIKIIIQNANLSINDVIEFPANSVRALHANIFDIPIQKYLQEKQLTIQAFGSYGPGDTFSTEVLTFAMPGSTGINLLQNSSFTVYPNPLSSSDMLNIYSPFAGELSILNLKGQKVYNSSVEFGRNTLIADLPKGVYFLKIINSSNATVSKKLLIQ